MFRFEELNEFAKDRTTANNRLERLIFTLIGKRFGRSRRDLNRIQIKIALSRSRFNYG